MNLIKIPLIIRIVICIVAAFVFVGILFWDDPPVKTETEYDPGKYMKVNRYVEKLRKEFYENGRITEGFLPTKIDPKKSTEYEYWYDNALFGDPAYAITITLQFSDDEALLNERNRLKGLEGFVETEHEDQYIITGKWVPANLKEFIEAPVYDRSPYSMEYAIISVKERTIMYTELYIWEGQRVEKNIRSQLEMLYEIVSATVQ